MKFLQELLTEFDIFKIDEPSEDDSSETELDFSVPTDTDDTETDEFSSDELGDDDHPPCDCECKCPCHDKDGENDDEETNNLFGDEESFDTEDERNKPLFNDDSEESSDEFEFFNR